MITQMKRIAHGVQDVVPPSGQLKDSLITFFLIGPYPLSVTVVRQTDYDLAIGQCVVFYWNLARAILISKTLSDGDVIVKVGLLP